MSALAPIGRTDFILGVLLVLKRILGFGTAARVHLCAGSFIKFLPVFIDYMTSDFLDGGCCFRSCPLQTFYWP